ncbi:MAG: glycoside hydrolase family 99-like domain-containing protein, partial [Candidatus Cryptobacteroides sp.]
MKKTFLSSVFWIAGIILCSSILYGCSQPEQEKYHVCALIWPSCHDDSLGRTNWPAGIGEWEVIQKGNPRFEGHYQPKEPLWGYEMDNDPGVVEKWINTALDYGVNTFIYDWYWFDHYPYLESALNDGFLKAPSNEKMEFF